MSLSSIVKQFNIGDGFFRRTPIMYSSFRKLLEKTNAMELAEERLAMSEQLLTQALQEAKKTKYAKTRKIHGCYDDWPFLDKETLRDEGESFNGRSFLPVAQATTGGTTGIPLKCTRSWRSVVFEQAVLDHLAAMSGVVWKRARLAVLRGDTIKAPSDLNPPYWKYRNGGKRMLLSSNHLNIQTIDLYIQALRAFEPEILWVYPTSLEALCRLAPNSQLVIPTLKLIVSSSEVLTPEMNAQARSILSAPVIDYYGQAERVCFSYSLDVGEHYFLPCYGRVELVRSHGDADFDYFEIVGTSYWNEAQPLIRYRTGDYARLPRGLNQAQIEEVCLGIRAFFGVAGRQGDYLVAPDGAHLIGINHIPRGIPDVVQMQFHQSALEPSHSTQL